MLDSQFAALNSADQQRSAPVTLQNAPKIRLLVLVRQRRSFHRASAQRAPFNYSAGRLPISFECALAGKNIRLPQLGERKTLAESSTES